ncbi:MAG: CBS domain-containing protein [Deltaproteobacteria bacterium]|nr:CBS domain-containing protein [Deltaproteobacteria bacterium]
MFVGEICNRQVCFVNKHNTVVEAAMLMRDHHVGALVVSEEREGKTHPVGLITDRDIVVEIIAEDLSVENLLVGDVMSFDLITIRESDGISEALKLMKGHGIRRLPVMGDEGELVGILAVDDLLELLAEELADVSQLIIREQERERASRK